jgi:serine/threonine protein kinase
MMPEGREFFPPDTRIDNWIIKNHIGHGGYGEIYAVSHPGASVTYAMKVQYKNAPKKGIAKEIRFLGCLQGSPCFPAFVVRGETHEISFFVMELLGPSISDLLLLVPRRKFSRFTTTLVSRQMLVCIQELHSRGFVHRDINPGNFLFRDDPVNFLCLIDFGLSRRYKDRITGEFIAPRDNPGFVGTFSFASINSHGGIELGRRDDIISWLYITIDMVDRGLPWPGGKNKKETREMKRTIPIAQLCQSLPGQFLRMFEMTIQLEFTDEPPYSCYFELLDEAIAEFGRENAPFDWERVDSLMNSCPGLPRRSPVDAPEVAQEVNNDMKEKPFSISQIGPGQKPIQELDTKTAPTADKKRDKDSEPEPICQMCNVC